MANLYGYPVTGPAACARVASILHIGYRSEGAMAERTRTSAGIQLGNVGRDVNRRVGGDIVGGDKTVTTCAMGAFDLFGLP
jgi:hypothetical protein